MQYKDIEFTIENAEKYSTASVILIKQIFNEWHISKDESLLFVESQGAGKYLGFTMGYALTNFKLRIPVEYRKMPLLVCGMPYKDWFQSGYSIHIDENGNPVGEPFKTESI